MDVDPITKPFVMCLCKYCLRTYHSQNVRLFDMTHASYFIDQSHIVLVMMMGSGTPSWPPLIRHCICIGLYAKCILFSFWINNMSLFIDIEPHNKMSVNFINIRFVYIYCAKFHWLVETLVKQLEIELHLCSGMAMWNHPIVRCSM